jgi:hypothetical protein
MEIRKADCTLQHFVWLGGMRVTIQPEQSKQEPTTGMEFTDQINAIMRFGQTTHK